MGRRGKKAPIANDVAVEKFVKNDVSEKNVAASENVVSKTPNGNVEKVAKAKKAPAKKNAKKIEQVAHVETTENDDADADASNGIDEQAVLPKRGAKGKAKAAEIVVAIEKPSKSKRGKQNDEVANVNGQSIQNAQESVAKAKPVKEKAADKKTAKSKSKKDEEPVVEVIEPLPEPPKKRGRKANYVIENLGIVPKKTAAPKSKIDAKPQKPKDIPVESDESDDIAQNGANVSAPKRKGKQEKPVTPPKKTKKEKKEKIEELPPSPVPKLTKKVRKVAELKLEEPPAISEDELPVTTSRKRGAAKKGQKQVEQPAADEEPPKKEVKEKSPKKPSAANVTSRKRGGNKNVPDDVPNDALVTKRSKPEKALAAEKKDSAPKMNATATDYSKIDFKNGDKDYNLKISSWNVAGLRALSTKNGLDYFEHEKPDIICLQVSNFFLVRLLLVLKLNFVHFRWQEIKCLEEEVPEAAKLKGYHPYWCSTPGGRGGVAILSKSMPYNVEQNLGDEEMDEEGRIITAEYSKFFLVNVYVPNAGRKLVCFKRIINKLNL